MYCFACLQHCYPCEGLLLQSNALEDSLASGHVGVRNLVRIRVFDRRSLKWVTSVICLAGSHLQAGGLQNTQFFSLCSAGLAFLIDWSAPM